MTANFLKSKKELNSGLDYDDYALSNYEASIAGLMLTTEAMIADIPEKDGEGGMGGGMPGGMGGMGMGM